MLYFAIFFILLIYIALFHIDIKAALEYIRNKRGEWLILSFYTRDGLLRYRYEIPLVKAEKDTVKFKLVKGQSRESRVTTENKKKLLPLDIYNKYISTTNYLKDHKSLFEDIRLYLNKKDVHVELSIHLKQGTGDAAQTGMICGLLWAAAGILTSYLSRYLKAFQKKITIKPCFNKRIFEVDASCIFHVKLVHIIVVLIKIYYKKLIIRLKAKKTIGGEVSG